MRTTISGRTNLKVSQMGIGAGGASQIGRKTGLTEAESSDLLCRAFDHGVNFIDTVEGYGTESIIGRALEGRDRSSIIISTKKSTRRQELTAQALQMGLDHSLQRLGTDYIDIYNLHGVVPQDYARLVANIFPALKKAQRQGKIRFIGLSEMFNKDLEHTMLQEALADDLWDVLMVGFNMLSQTAREKVFAKAIAKNVGIQIMFAVRNALSHPNNLRRFITNLVDKGQINRAEVEDFPNFLLAEATSLPDAAYRFCRDEPGVPRRPLRYRQRQPSRRQSRLVRPSAT